jgi:hypothetical protein
LPYQKCRRDKNIQKLDIKRIFIGANFTTALLANNLPIKENNAKKAEDCSAKKNLPKCDFIKSGNQELKICSVKTIKEPIKRINQTYNRTKL